MKLYIRFLSSLDAIDTSVVDRFSPLLPGQGAERPVDVAADHALDAGAAPASAERQRPVSTTMLVQIDLLFIASPSNRVGSGLWIVGRPGSTPFLLPPSAFRLQAEPYGKPGALLPR